MLRQSENITRGPAASSSKVVTSGTRPPGPDDLRQAGRETCPERAGTDPDGAIERGAAAVLVREFPQQQRAAGRATGVEYVGQLGQLSQLGRLIHGFQRVLALADSRVVVVQPVLAQAGVYEQGIPDLVRDLEEVAMQRVVDVQGGVQQVLIEAEELDGSTEVVAAQ